MAGRCVDSRVGVGQATARFSMFLGCTARQGATLLYCDVMDAARAATIYESYIVAKKILIMCAAVAVGYTQYYLM